MDSSLIPLLDFPFISMLADRVANIFLSDKSTIPPHMKLVGYLCFYMTRAVMFV